MTSLGDIHVRKRPRGGEQIRRRRTRRRRGASPPSHAAFTLAETVMSTLLVGGLLVVALDTVGSARVGHRKMADRGRGQLLAQDLMAEILSQAYEEPVDTPRFGRESSEAGASRALYDDVDDYDNWSSSPPEYKDGTAISGLIDWRRTVVVEYVDSDDLTLAVAMDLGVKRITVDVDHNDQRAASLVAIRTRALDDAAATD